MLNGWRQRPLADLLEEHELSGRPEQPFPTDGWSGARFSLIEGHRERFVLKRTSPRTDWIAAATGDDDSREAWIAGLGDRFEAVPSPLPYLGAAADGDEAAILLPDLSVELLAWERPAHEAALPVDDLDRVLAANARLHGQPWPDGLDRAGPFPWCPIRERLLLTSRSLCARHLASGIPAGIASAERLLAGWDAFERRASVAARDLVAGIEHDPAPLLAALERLPAVGLHGDLKLANVALGAADEDVRFIDWQMTIRAPVAVELGWFLVSNSGSLPEPPLPVAERYRWWAGTFAVLTADAPGPAPVEVVGDWEAQLDLTWIVGLLLRGWRKGLDAESGAILASGVSGAEDLAWWSTAAVEAAARRL